MLGFIDWPKRVKLLTTFGGHLNLTSFPKRKQILTRDPERDKSPHHQQKATNKQQATHKKQQRTQNTQQRIHNKGQRTPTKDKEHQQTKIIKNPTNNHHAHFGMVNSVSFNERLDQYTFVKK